MTDLEVLIPSRGRPGSVERVVRAYALTCRADTKIRFAFDDDDPELEDSIAAAQGHSYMTGPRDSLAGWTNKLARRHMSHAPALASLGDDHLPVTEGWDVKLLEALPPAGGFAYPNDERRVDIPEAVVISAAIVRALGWMCQPTLRHWHVDQVWAMLGRGTDSLVFCPDVLVRHLHPNVTRKTRVDTTYTDAAEDWDADLRAYARWKLYSMRADIATVAGVRAAAANPV